MGPPTLIRKKINIPIFFKITLFTAHLDQKQKYIISLKTYSKKKKYIYIYINPMRTIRMRNNILKSCQILFCDGKPMMFDE